MLLRRYTSSFAKWMTVKEAFNSKISETPRNNTQIKGWVTSIRKQKKLTFIHINDGSSHADLQVVANTDLIKECAKITYGSSIEVVGALLRSTHPGQPVELHPSQVTLLGACNTEEYPFKAKIKHSLDYIRQRPHLRPRIKQFASILRIRNDAVMAVHEFFQRHNYTHIHTPIITSSDCEGSGELFQVIPSGHLNQGPGSEKTFFKNQAYLTVSGQLYAEAATCGLSRVYTFGPTFRAEQSHTSRHLAEFYMLEAETVLQNSENGQEELMQLSENLCKHVLHSLVTKSTEDMDLFHNDDNTKNVFKKCIDEQYKRISYTDAIDVLKKHYNGGATPKFGEGLSTDNEKFIVDHFGSQPVFVTDYPAVIKPFYAKSNSDDSSLSQAIDLLMPGIGEVIGGTVREDDYLLLKDKLSRLGSKDEYDWYLNLREYGSVPHCGFGLGFDRLLQVALGINNIRDIVLFPRYLGYCPM